MEKSDDLQVKIKLTSEEELHRHNLETRKYWSLKLQDKSKLEKSKVAKDRLPNKWHMLKGISLYSWQKESIEAWLNRKSGTIKVVTGAGKTILALGIIERLQNINKNLRVVVVVPTIVLQSQWYEEILKLSNLPAKAVGRLGGGYDDSFNKGKRIMICVLKSAADKLTDMVDKDLSKDLLLVVDECHRAGSKEMSQIFNINRAYNLGLSATPERDELTEENLEVIFGDAHYNDSKLGKELGPIVYELKLREAFELGILPEFEVRHYALSLEKKERKEYEKLTRTIQDLRLELMDRSKSKKHFGEGMFLSWCQSLAKQDGEVGDLARSFVSKTSGRKQLLYKAKAREEAVIKVLKQEFAVNPQTKAILFHESINDVMNLYYKLLLQGFPVVAENSMLPDSIRENSIELFRRGTAQVIVSARSLIEGFNVPSTDIGIIVASSTSVRQRIQTLGRVLRKTEREGKEKEAVVYVFYMQNTTDEIVYSKTDWNELIGAKRNRYFYWNLKEKPYEVEGPPRVPLPKEKDIEQDELQAGGGYPGEYTGEEYSCDVSGNVFDSQGNPVSNPQGLPEKIKKVKGSYGRFKVTPTKRYVLALVFENGEWEARYVTTLEEPFTYEIKEKKKDGFEPKKAKPGDEFPRYLLNGEEETYFFKQSRGKYVIARKKSRGEVYAREGERAEDASKGEDAVNLLRCIKGLREKSFCISKFYVTSDGHAVFLEKGKYRYICTLEVGLEFP